MKFLSKYINYLFTIIRFTFTVLLHKYCILITGLQINKKLKGSNLSIPLIRLLKHDLSKFSFSEFWSYASFYYGDKDQHKYEKAWLHHLRANDHHWEHYIVNYTIGMNVDLCSQNALEMKNEAILEMATDWLSAERAYKGRWPIPGQWVWAQNSVNKIGMNPISKKKFFALLAFLGFGADIKEVFIEKLEGNVNLLENLYKKK